MRNAEMHRKYPLSFSPIRVGKISIPNRIVFPPWNAYRANDGEVSEELLRFYGQFAASGCGLVMTGAVNVSYDSVVDRRAMRIDDDRYIPGLKRLFAELENKGAVPGIQIFHNKRQALKSKDPPVLLVPSKVPGKRNSEYTVREMTTGDMEKIRNDFIHGAMRAEKAGAKVIEIHAAHSYLLADFLSPYSNKRTDHYGGNRENRTRYVKEILEGVKKHIKNDVAISVRVSAHEFVPGGLVPSDFKEVVPVLEKAGMDMLHVSVGHDESEDMIVPVGEEAPYQDIADELKSYSTVPVCTVASIRHVRTAELILATGKADLAAAGRAQVADPEWVKKSREGREDEIITCIQCNKCFSLRDSMFTQFNCAKNRPS